MAFMSPREIIRQLPILPGDTTLDIGAGAGAFTYEIAQLYPQNRTIAMDINTNTLDLIAHNATMLNYKGVETMYANIEKPWPMSDLYADSALLINVLHAIDMSKHKDVFAELYRVLKPHAFAIISDWNGEASFGPDKNSIITEAQMRKIVVDNNFKIVKDVPAGVHHYALMIEKL